MEGGARPSLVIHQASGGQALILCNQLSHPFDLTGVDPVHQRLDERFVLRKPQRHQKDRTNAGSVMGPLRRLRTALG